MSHTDIKLKQALAKMLPDKIHNWKDREFEWRNTGVSVKDTELLHLCSLVEKSLNRESYSNKLKSIIQDQHGWVSGAVEARYETCRATWRQRVMALAKVKGVDI